MSKQERTIIAVLVFGVLVVFCALSVFGISLLQKPSEEEQLALVVTPGASSTPRPTSTPPPTWPPTWTPSARGTPTWVIQRVVPTPTRLAQRAPLNPPTPAPSRTRVSGPIPDAWDKTSNAKSQRFEMNMTLAGDIWNLPGATGSKIEFSFVNLGGEFQGRDSHFLMKGYVADLLIPTDNGIEMVTRGDDVYLHGPVPLLGAPDDKWYVERAEILDSFRPLSRPANWLIGYSSSNWSSFKKAAAESLDGKSCDTYVGDKSATLLWYQSANPEDIPSQNLFAAFDAAEGKLWVCDGYVHQFHVSLTTHSKYDVKQKGTLQLQMHFYDINTSIQIPAPANAVPLNIPTPVFDTL